MVQTSNTLDFMKHLQDLLNRELNKREEILDYKGDRIYAFRDPFYRDVVGNIGICFFDPSIPFDGINRGVKDYRRAFLSSGTVKVGDFVSISEVDGQISRVNILYDLTFRPDIEAISPNGIGALGLDVHPRDVGFERADSAIFDNNQVYQGGLTRIYKIDFETHVEVLLQYETKAVGVDTEYPSVIVIDALNENLTPYSCGSAVSDVPYHSEVMATITYYTNVDEVLFDNNCNRIAGILGRQVARGGYYWLETKNSRAEFAPNKWKMTWDVVGRKVS